MCGLGVARVFFTTRTLVGVSTTLKKVTSSCGGMHHEEQGY